MAEINVDDYITKTLDDGKQNKTNLKYKMYCGQYCNNGSGGSECYGCHYYNVDHKSDTMCYKGNSMEAYKCMMNKINDLQK